MNKPLSELFRPKSLDFVAGQKHLANPKDGIITRMLATNNIKSMIFTGPPGTGKSTKRSCNRLKRNERRP